MIQARKLGHIVLKVRDAQTSKEFYTRALGLKVAHEDHEHGEHPKHGAGGRLAQALARWHAEQQGPHGVHFHTEGEVARDVVGRHDKRTGAHEDLRQREMIEKGVVARRRGKRREQSQTENDDDEHDGRPGAPSLDGRAPAPALPRQEGESRTNAYRRDRHWSPIESRHPQEEPDGGPGRGAEEAAGAPIEGARAEPAPRSDEPHDEAPEPPPRDDDERRQNHAAGGPNEPRRTHRGAPGQLTSERHQPVEQVGQVVAAVEEKETDQPNAPRCREDQNLDPPDHR